MKPRKYTEEFKKQILREVEKIKNISLVARNHNISKSTIYTWIKNSKDRGKIKTKIRRKSGVKKEIKCKFTKITEENDQLKKLLGEKELQIAILKGLIKKSDSKEKLLNL